MNSLPSPAASAEHSPRSPPSTPRRLGTKRARSASSEASSSKRAMSEEPYSQDPPSSAASPPSRSGDDDIDVYMRDQGEQDITLHVPTHTTSSSSQMLPTDPDERFRYIDDLKEREMVPGEYWYLVNYSWYRLWEKACCHEYDKGELMTEDKLSPPDNASFFKDGVFDHSASLIESVDVEFVPAEAWDAFIQWYGSTPHEIRRKVITLGINKVPSLELRPLRLSVYSLCSDQETITDDGLPPVIEFSSQETEDEVKAKLVESNLLSGGSSYRLWVVADLEKPKSKVRVSELKAKDGRRLSFKDSSQTLEEAYVTPTDSFVLEKCVFGNWILDPADVPSSGGTTTIDDDAGGSRGGIMSTISSAAGYAKQKMFSSDSKSSSSSNLTRKYNSSLVPGNIGFTNLGNTCFMNSALQCLAHTKELVEYFMTGVFNDELNPDNPLGMQGAIAEAFGVLLNRVWIPQSSSFAPREFKMQLSRFASQFSGYQQQDSQELVAFLLDGLHEDLNRVLKKPYVEKPDWEGGGDKELVALARKSWEGYMKRNDSVIVDLFQGQYRSTLVCPECKKVSITFDPFMYLTLPLPVQKKWSHTILYIPWDASKKHVKVPVEVNRNASFKEVRNLLGRWMDAEPNNLLTMEIFSNRFYKYLDDTIPVSDMTDNDTIACFELPCHAQQSRSWTPDPDPSKNPLILPVHLCRESSAPGSYTRSNGFAHPFVIVLDQAEGARKQEKIYAAIIERLERWTGHSQDLYSWEERVVANGAVPEEEGDIVDEKAAIMMEDPAEAPPASSETPVLVGPKPKLFDIRIQAGHEKLGAGNTWGGKWEDWEKRVDDMENGSTDTLLLEGDALFCEWDSNVRDYYFGEEPNFSDARWTDASWEKFIHPEYKESRDAANAKKKKSISLQDCLEEFTREEELGEEDLWYCPQCKKHQQATKKFDLWNVPDVLVVHLKRFSNSRIMRDKIDAFVDFPIDGLNLEPFCGEREVAKRLLAAGEDVAALGLHELDEPLLYDLYAVDEHIGGLGGGHYRAYAMNHDDNKWYHFDDSHVSPSTAKDSVNANAYLLFYKRRSDRPIGGKTFEKIEEARHRMAESEAETVAQANLPTPPEDATELAAEDRVKGASKLLRNQYKRKNASNSSLAAQHANRDADESDNDSPFGDRYRRTPASGSGSPVSVSSNTVELGDDVGNLEEVEFDDSGSTSEEVDKKEEQLLHMPMTDSALHDIDL